MCQRYTLQNGMLIACYLKVWLFFSGAMMMVILETDDQMVRCGSRSSGRGLFEETVAMCAMLVGGARCACAFRKLRFGDVGSIFMRSMRSLRFQLKRIWFCVCCCHVVFDVLPTRKGAF